MNTVEGFRRVVALLRAEGFTVVERPGWETRGHGVLRPRGMVNHDTITGRSWTLAAVLRLLEQGHAGLRGTLANWSDDRDGTIYLHAAGLAYHAGRGGWQGLAGNSSVIGLEQHNSGTESHRAQIDAAVALNRHCADVFGFSESRICEHFEWTRRKQDRATVRGAEFRARVRNYRPESWELGDRLLREMDPYMRGADVETWQTALIDDFGQGTPGKDVTADGVFGRLTHNGTERAQRRMGITVDGVVGPQTLAAWRARGSERPVIPPHDWEVTVRWEDLPDEGAARVLGAAHTFRVLHADDPARDLVRVRVGYAEDARGDDVALAGADRNETARLVAAAVNDVAWAGDIRAAGRRLAGQA